MWVHHEEITFSNTYVLIKIEHALKQKNVCINNNVTKIKNINSAKVRFENWQNLLTTLLIRFTIVHHNLRVHCIQI